MTLGFLDFNSYTFVGGFTVQRGKDLIIPDSLVLSQTMLIKWQIRQLVKGATIEQIPPAILSAALEIQGLGTLSTDTQEIYPSQQGKDVVQLWTIDPSLPHLLKFSQVSDLVTNSILEFYSSSLSLTNLSNFNSNNMANTTNPYVAIQQDLTPIVTAITAGNTAQIAATQAVSQSINKTVKREVEYAYSPLEWSGTPNNHISTQINANRIGVELINTGNRPVAVDTFADITKKTNAMSYDTVVAPGGIYRLEMIEAGLGVMVYTVPGMGIGAAKVQMKDQFPDVLPAANPGNSGGNNV